MNDKLPWSESGKQLLLAIQSYIDQHGGRKGLLNKIYDEDRELRKKKYLESYTGRYYAAIRVDRKCVLARRGESKGKFFKNTTDAAIYFGTKSVSIRASIHGKYKHLGLKFEYI